ncbi:MAG: sensor histidine kinase [Halobacteriaceae archaeon]
MKSQTDFEEIQSILAPPDNLSTPTIAVLVKGDEDQTLLTEWLNNEYNIIESIDAIETTDVSLDLCILDESAVEGQLKTFRQWQAQAEPRYLPFLFLQSSEQAVPEDVRELIDDRCMIPIERRELAWRIQSLIRTRSLSVRLAQQKAIAEEFAQQNERLENFVNTLAHDIRNPLQVARGHLVHLETADGEHIEKIRDALDRIQTITEDVLSVAKGGEFVREIDTKSLSTLINESWKTTDTKSATLDIDGDCEITGDTDRLQRMFENLIQSAIERCGEDVTIRVGTLSNTQGIYFADDGPGLTKSERKDLFEVGGLQDDLETDIGLPLVNQIVKAHGWDIKVTDSQSGGTRFEFTGLQQI